MGTIFSPVLNLLKRANRNASVDARSYTESKAPAQKSLCAAPSVNMHFETNGFVKACCHNSENSLGKYPEQTISEIWNSSAAESFRKQLNEHKFLSGCHVCAADYEGGHMEEMPATHFEAFNRNQKYPTMMEFLLDNTCNLECVMCTGYLSSSIRKNRDKLPPIQSPYDDKFIDQLQEFIPHLVEARFSGAGEAFSIGINFKIWEAIIATNPACQIVVQTNATILNARAKDFLQRGNFKIGVSLDSLQKDRFEKIRVNASFDQVMKNIRYFSEYNKERNKVFNVCTCVMRNNWDELPDFISFCNDIGARAVFHKVWSPAKFGLYNLPEKELTNIYNQLSGYVCPSSTPLQRKNKLHYDYYVSVIKKWMLEAPHRQKNNTEVEHKSISELLQYINIKLTDFISTQEIPEPEKIQLRDSCMYKIEAVTTLWKKEDEKRKMLISLCLSHESDILAYVKDQSIEKLYEMSVAATEI